MACCNLVAESGMYTFHWEAVIVGLTHDEATADKIAVLLPSPQDLDGELVVSIAKAELV